MKTFEITTASTHTESQISCVGCFFNAHTCGWLYGCCYVPSPDISPGVEQSVRQQYSGYSWDIHTPCFSTGCTLGQTHPVLAGPQFLEVEIKSFDLYVNYSLVYTGWYWRNNSALLGWRRKERKKKKVCAHRSPSYFLGPCHPGKNSPALLPGGPQSKVPGKHPPLGQTGCPELGPGREEKDTQCCLIALLCFCSEAIQPHVSADTMCISKSTRRLPRHCTSSLLLSRLDTETSSIFICQNYQMSRHCCGHAVAQQALAKTGLQREGYTSKQHGGKQWMQISLWVRCVDLQLHVEHCQGVTSQRFKTWGKNDINLALVGVFPLLSTATTQKTKQTNNNNWRKKENVTLQRCSEYYHVTKVA